MVRVFEYYSRFQGLRGRIIQLPAWSRVLIFIAALPGVLLISLSLLALLVSILALLLLTVPLYRLLQALVGRQVEAPTVPTSSAADVFGFTTGDAFAETSPGRKKVDVTIVECVPV